MLLIEGSNPKVDVTLIPAVRLEVDPLLALVVGLGVDPALAPIVGLEAYDEDGSFVMDFFMPAKYIEQRKIYSNLNIEPSK